MRFVVRWMVACSVAWSALVMAPASAQRRADPSTQARQLFGLGVEQASRQEYAAAAGSFREALRLRDAPAIRYNLASVLYELGDYPEAHELAVGLTRDDGTPSDIRAQTTELDGQLLGAAGFVRAASGWVPAGGTLAIDGYVVRDASAEVPVRPGRHEIVVREGSDERHRESVTVSFAQHLEVGAAPAREEPAPPSPSRPLPEEEWFWPAVGVAGGVIVVVAVVLVATNVDPGVEAPIEGDFMPGVIRW